MKQKAKPSFLLLSLLFLSPSSAQNGVTSPLAYPCPNYNTTTSSVLCVNRYASVMPYHFFRQPDGPSTNTRPFGSTQVPNDTSFSAISSAPFLVFDPHAAATILGPSPTYDYVFPVTPAVHEAPAYVPAQHKLYLSRLAPPPGFLPQLVIDLNASPPTLSEYLSSPPVYAPNGGTFHRGKIIWGASGGNRSAAPGLETRPGLVALDPATNTATYLLNNYFGFYFNTVDDVAVHPRTGHIWFTDPVYSWLNALSDTPPQLPPASWRFEPETGAAVVVEDTLKAPNGIAFAPGGEVAYISDTGAILAPVSDERGAQAGATFDPRGARGVYAFDVGPDGLSLSGRRVFYLAQDWVPDGLKVAANGMVLTAAGRGVDVLDTAGRVLVRVQTNYTVQNFAWVEDRREGRGRLTELWMMGQGGISRVRWALEGIDLAAL